MNMATSQFTATSRRSVKANLPFIVGRSDDDGYGLLLHTAGRADAMAVTGRATREGIEHDVTVPRPRQDNQANCFTGAVCMKDFMSPGVVLSFP